MSGLLVAGIGNLLLGDDGFGVEVARRLAGRSLPAHVRVVDVGIRGFDLAFALMDPWERVILVDALPRGGAPGTLYLFEPDASDPGPPVQGHSLAPARVLALVRALGVRPRVQVVGCQPGELPGPDELRIGLSPPVAAAVDRAVELIEELVESPHHA